MQGLQEQIIEQIKGGDKGAFRQLVEPYRNRAFGLCYSLLGNTEDAKDILQEAFIKAYRNISRFKKASSFYTWFYTIVVNTARDFLRKRGRREEPLSDEIADLSLSPASLALNSELNKLLEQAIQKLPEKQRLSFTMKHINGMKVLEIAGILHCRPATIKVHLFRAVRNLQKILMPQLANHS